MPPISPRSVEQVSSQLILGDCNEKLLDLKPNSIDAIVTDPPYMLGFMGKEWDSLPKNLQGLRMEEWYTIWLRKALNILKPGKYMLCFGGTRTYHRVTSAAENVGFEIRDCLIWLYGSGLPKSKACLKPAYEPILLCSKPGKGKHDLNIEECRIPSTDGKSRSRDNSICAPGGFFNRKKRINQIIPDGLGRWPANVVHDGEVLELYHANATNLFYCAKASKSEREMGLEKFPVREAGSLTGRADEGSLGHKVFGKNHHPTIKPLELMKWLVKLISFPSEIVLDPFMGSGTTGIACKGLGRAFIGMEKEQEYFNIAEARIKAANMKG
jgi:site-specific DNA-methyltransferase (adenine-specific)